MNTLSLKNHVFLLAFSLLFIFIGFFFPDWLAQVEVPLFIGLVILTGIPHGATDHIIYQYNQEAEGGSFSLLRFLGIYLLGMAGFAIVWWFFPLISLGIFLLISAFHFGQSQLLGIRLPEKSSIKALFYIIWGSWVLACIILSNPEMSNEILKSLIEGEEGFFDRIFANTKAIILLFFLANAGLFIYAISNQWLKLSEVGIELLNMIVLLLLTQFTGLLVSFAIYFCLWHGLTSIRIEYRALKERNPDYKWSRFVLDALPFTLISLLGMGLIIQLGTLWFPSISPYLVFFILISTVTLPHFLHMWGFYGRVGGRR